MDTLKLMLLFTGLNKAASLDIKVYSENPTSFGDAPHWCARTNSLYYVDFFGIQFNIYRFDYSKSKVFKASILKAPSNAGFIIPIEGYRNEFAVGFADRKVHRIFWDGRSEEAYLLCVIFKVEQDPYYKDNIWHIGKTDPFGRFYGGTMRKQLCTRLTNETAYGSVYSYNSRRNGITEVTRQINSVELSNGIAHSVCSRRMFHINACDFAVKAYEWNNVTGKISNGKKIYQVYKGSDVPTVTGLGLAIDRDDNLYVARYNGSSIVKVNSRTGKELKVFDIPTAFTLNVAFGGPDLKDLFVVTGKMPFDLFTGTLTDQELTPTAGFLYVIKNVGTTGYAGTPLRLTTRL